MSMINIHIYIKSTFFKAQENSEFTLILGLSLPSPVTKEYMLTREPNPGGKTPPWRLFPQKHALAAMAQMQAPDNHTEERVFCCGF